MPEYYVSKTAQPNGDHEVHQAECEHLPAEENRIYLGVFGDCYSAIAQAKRYYAKVNGCSSCSQARHTG